jgi:GNAT superfamily N-acetyltransferase
MNSPPITLKNLQERARFRFADGDDIDELIPIYGRFYSEAVYKDHLTLDPAKVRDTIETGILADIRPHILAIADDHIVGFISYVFDRSFSVEPCQVLMELYVVPEYRRSALGRSLVGLAIMEGQRAGAGAFHAPVASGMVEAKTLFNLFSKAGFTQFGYLLRKKL